MNPIFKKLNYKAQSAVYILQAPQSFKADMSSMEELTTVKTSLPKSNVEFVLAFVTKQDEVNNYAEKIAGSASEDAVIWFAYPKGTSKKYKCEFNRDNGWAKLGELGFEGVRMVAIDEDWSALRFRKAENIKTMTRRSAMSEKGKEKIAAKKK